MRVLVTGAAGFIGSRVAAHCRELEMEVVGLDNLSAGLPENVPAGVTFAAVDLCDAGALEQVFATHGPFDVIYHLAAYASEGRSHFVRAHVYRNNLLASANLVNQAVRHRAGCLVYTSSIAVYGSADLPFREETPPCPEDPYAVSKYAVELDLKAAHRVFGLDSIIFRPHNVYGERQNLADPTRNVIGIFLTHLWQGLPMPLYGDGSQTRAFTYVGDVAPLIARSPLVTDARNQLFNVGSEEAHSVAELAQLIAGTLELPCRTVSLSPRCEVQHAHSSSRKAAQLFGPLTETPLANGLRRTLSWAQAWRKERSLTYVPPPLEIEECA